MRDLTPAEEKRVRDWLKEQIFQYVPCRLTVGGELLLHMAEWFRWARDPATGLTVLWDGQAKKVVALYDDWMLAPSAVSPGASQGTVRAHILLTYIGGAGGLWRKTPLSA